MSIPADEQCSHGERELDCGRCRAELLRAFSGPAEAQAHLVEPLLKPHLILDDPAWVVPFIHTVQTVVTPHGHRPGGTWQAWCTCGWIKSGGYLRDNVGAMVAQRLAEAWATQHLKNPLEGTEDR